MSACIEMGENAKIGNIAIRVPNDETAVLMTGANSHADGVEINGIWGDGDLVIVGDDCHVSDLRVFNSFLAGVEVTGDRADISGVSSWFGDGAGVRLNGSAGSTVRGLHSRQAINGLIVLDSTRWTATDVYIETTGEDGIIIDGSSLGRLDATVYNAGQHGIRVTDSSDNRIGGQVVDAGQDNDNTYDGVLVEGDSNRNRTALTVTYQGAGDQMRYGLNLSAATVDDHVEASILTGAGATADFNDAGTGTVLTDDHVV